VPSLSATNSFTLTVNEMNSAPTLTLPANQTINELMLWTTNATAMDADLPPNALTFELVSGPSGLTVSTNGLISWIPTEAQGPSTNVVTVRVFDNGMPSLSATNSFTLTVNEMNSAPTLTLPANQTINELMLWTTNATAVDADLPPDTLTFELVSGPSGLIVSTNGLISWAPTEAQGPSTNVVTLRVSDNGVPSLSATNTFTLTVNEVNTPPVLPIQTNLTIAGLVTLVLTNAATDSDIPSNALVYVLLNAPTNAVIDTNGVITWTPEPDRSPSTNVFMTAVMDHNPWAADEQNLSATNNFTVVVAAAAHNGPTLPAQPDRTVGESVTLVVTNSATDTDIPLPVLTYQLVEPSVEALIDTNGVITWTPNEYDGPGTYVIRTVVTDNGVPPLSATNSVRVTVNEVNSPPVLQVLTDAVLSAGDTFTFLNSASDTDKPANSMTYHLIGAPLGAAIDADGLITWTPEPWQVPSTNVFTTVATDYNPWAVSDQHLSTTNSFTLRVFEPGNPPVIVSLDVGNDTALITWSTITGRTYRLQYKDSPSASNWSDLPPDIAATGARTTATNSLDNSPLRLYRVFQVP
jgi:large repetitive protein